MDTRVLKEPRGFMRCLEWFFAILAFATCCDFSTVSEYTVMCSNPSQKNWTVQHTISYPFRYLNILYFFDVNNIKIMSSSISISRIF